MIDLTIGIFFTICAGLIVYHHVGYPLVLAWYSKRHPVEKVKPIERGYKIARSDRQCADITILIPAYNEEQWIADKIRNLACLDYPKEHYNVIVACDGCTDNTAQVAQNTIQEAICCDTHFEIRVFEENRGKVALVNEQMLTISSDITALSDVSALISVDALLVANQHFKDKTVGAVNGHYQLLSSGSEGESKYWQYQSRMKLHEASLGSTLGAHGAFYLFRTHLFEPLKQNVINDDFIIPMEIIRKGYRVDYDKDMIALELEATNTDNDFKRRLRISAGNMQQALQLAELFLPRYKGVAFAFFSGKGLRLITPYLMILCLALSVVLIHHPIFFIGTIVQLAVYSVAILGHVFPHIFSHKYCQLITYIVAGHFANLIGGLRYLFGFEATRWTRIQ
ncbi:MULTISPECIES: glycosyltransferase family 2 protein [Vibrio]|uniref:glycosyltransferase family 2 protein n=1 Tax=Vibrio TaxID=662 RepID=UPI002076170B|nr:MULTISPECIES: glycosyltransferase family 2 protein [Vibrio]USD31261.1 glycosyltransferase family 2 protein [Vibrio sp. SCSIO 43186]USD44307.1 glycosyltransferase family 2 protein [Vibrio sp. SCSIO 43145]USD68384.1 glycosyltransferase family 2 protein [Vibrio sp. SCSIO 43139]USD96070.1 glycosyl transferase [Vibrio coralliilyticus]